jgi:iron-sulfur cluster assembly accessory protein
MVLLHMVHGQYIRKRVKLITLTENAKEYLKKSAEPGDYVTLGVKGGGCSGWTYVWDFKKNWPDVNWSDPIDDILVLGCTVDYVNELGGSYLKIINPNSVASCGCGESFAV